MFRWFHIVAIAALALGVSHGTARAQTLTVNPVSIQMAAGQMAATLTVTNEEDSETSFQLRAFAWQQENGEDQLSPTEELLASPPLGTIQPKSSQVVRIILRRPPQEREATYRILFDQIPPPPAPGMVRIALRLSIPIFAEPMARVAAHVQWRLERDHGQISLAASNDGNGHELVRDIALATAAGGVLKLDGNQSPYLLAGATRRWRLSAPGPLPAPDTTVRLTAHTNTHDIDEPIPVVK